MDLGLAGKKIIVNGAARGIGRRIVELAAEEGADLAFFSRSAEMVKGVADAIARSGQMVIGEALDMNDSDAYVAWLKSAAERLGGCDIFIHTASSSGAGATGDWDASFKLDVMGAVRACETLEPFLEASGDGSVVMMSSTAAVETFIRPQAFNAMKAAVITYASQLSQSWGAKNIRVNVVTPGPVEFEGGNWDKIKTAMRPFYDAQVATVPLGRLGTPDDVAPAVLFLASPLARYITGTNVIVDGGYTKRVQF
jgi:NAD(P)-dependent dehydrogenase (short-subunit alcohol dehydrogenase family)